MTLLESKAPLPTIRVRLEGEELIVQVGEQGGVQAEKLQVPGQEGPELEPQMARASAAVSQT